MKYKYKKLIFTATASVMLLGMVIFSTKGAGKTGNLRAASITAVNESGNAATNGSIEAENSTSSDIAASSPASGETGGASGESEGLADESEALTSSEAESEASTALSSGTLLKNAYSETNDLVTAYLKALADGDTDTIAKCVENMDYVDTDSIKKRSEMIESIDNIVCYTLDGPEKGAHMAYVYNEVKIKGIKTAASSLDGFYIRPDADGNLKIVAGPVDDSIQAILDSDTKREDVKALLSDVNTRLAKEISNDSDLKEYFNKLSKDSSESSDKEETDKEDKE